MPTHQSANQRAGLTRINQGYVLGKSEPGDIGASSFGRFETEPSSQPCAFHDLLLSHQHIGQSVGASTMS